MEEIYVNPANKTSIKKHTGPWRRKRSIYLVVILSLGLLAGLLTRAFCWSNELSSMTEERDLLKANLTEMTNELERLQSLFNQKKTCPAGWSKFSCSCYLLSESSDSWHSARKHCTDQGADLVVIDSPKEQDFVTSFTQKETWIGLNDIEQEGTWKWVDGSPLTLQYWAPHQPDDLLLSEDCAHIRYQGTSWNDERCENSLQWVCEKLL
ncbi:CD209 antigen-like protein A isoform X2 [Oreochromis aureus]|uniref:CD209 antigen-like protein A isoform X2 n=1 Tax=Oreochromis aureus TaxID=47969 RepID=UPI001953C0DD|nr:CD209 antigen-like protein A isoform X2 [Oreochromis aureus]